jgi:hypothetical protein
VAGDSKIPPSEEPLGGWGPLQKQMEAMERDAEAIIDRSRATTGDAAARYRLAEMEIHFAMRDEFGPANGALFGAREKKLKELAGAVGATSAPEPLTFAVDSFVRETRSFAQQIRATGLQVVESPVTARRLLWKPGEIVGWELVVSDPKRSVEEDVPYSGTAHGAPASSAPGKVSPSIHLYVFPHVRMSAAQSMVRREQPGEPMAAGEATVLFRLQAAQSHDQDPGGTIARTVEAALFREATSKELPAAAKALGGGTAVLSRGLLRVTGRGEPPAEVPELGVPEARLIHWTVQQGADIDHTLLPVR